MDILSHLRGLPGVFLTCIFSGSLSSLSSGINSMAAVTLQDYIRPYCPYHITDFRATFLTKVTAAFFGLLAIGLAFLASKLGSILQVSYTVISSFDGPLFGVFILGLFFPWANNKGTIIGYLLSLAFMLWISVGSFLYQPPPPVSSFSLHGCNNSLGDPQTPVVNTTHIQDTEYLSIYRLSYLYYTATGAFTTVIAGVIVSCITGYGKSVDTDPHLLHPAVKSLCPCYPSRDRGKHKYSGISTGQELTHVQANGNYPQESI